MGAWGYEPWDNDDYGDMTDASRRFLADQVWKKHQEAVDVRGYGASRALMYAWSGFVIRCIRFDPHTFMERETIPDLAYDYLTQLLDDEDWLEQWEEPKEVGRAIKAALRELDEYHAILVERRR